MSMFRIVGQQVVNGKKVGGVLMAGEFVPGLYDVSVFEVNGHREVSARQAVVWREVDDWSEHRDACGNLLEPEPLTDAQIAADLEEKRKRSLEKSAKRAKTQCRRQIKQYGFREMLTGTYRENQQDRELFLKHVASFIKAMQYAFKKIEYVVSFERQDRGAYHFHMATNRLPRFVHYRGQKLESWTVPTLIWRKIVGEDNGLVFVGGKPRWGSARRRNLSLAKIASYVSKYILKDCGDCPENAKRYWASRGLPPAKAECTQVQVGSIDELVHMFFTPGQSIVSHAIGRWGDSYWLCTEPAS